jgi:hypothetical protein
MFEYFYRRSQLLCRFHPDRPHVKEESQEGLDSVLRICFGSYCYNF